MDARLMRFRERHAALDRELRQELARPAPELTRVATIKRRKLWLKDMMAGQTTAAVRA
jgi:hypothetical protein